MKTSTLQRRATLSGLVAWLIVAGISCRQPTSRERMLGARALKPPPSSDGSCIFDLTGNKADTVFFVLGMLNEYNGRSLMEESDLVEGFYCNEAGKSQLFRRYIGKLAQEQSLNPAVREETIQKCLVSYYSQPIADRLNSCYRYAMTDQVLAQARDGTYRRTANPSLLGAELFARGGGGVVSRAGLFDEAFFRRRALAYLAGAWARYGHGNDFVFANARDKATLVSGLLMNLGCQNIRIESTVGTIPQANYVHFEPTGEVMEWLRKEW